jgi:hypothetical protein
MNHEVKIEHLELQRDKLELIVAIKERQIKYIEEQYRELTKYCESVENKLIKAINK